MSSRATSAGRRDAWSRQEGNVNESFQASTFGSKASKFIIKSSTYYYDVPTPHYVVLQPAVTFHLYVNTDFINTLNSAVGLTLILN